MEYRNPKDIQIDGKSLADIIVSHEKWLRGEVDGERADLYGANLYGADLRSANLESANLRSANLRSANLESANLESANLRSANLRSANLYGANLYGANGLFLLGPIGSRGDFLYAVKHDSKIMVKAGCFWGTLAEFKAAVKKTHGGNLHDKTYSAAIVLVRKYFKILEGEQS